MFELIQMPRHPQLPFWAFLIVLVFSTSGSAQQGTAGEWHVHGGDSGYTRYSSLDQINTVTVGDLDIAWRRSSVDASLIQQWPDLQYSNQLRSTPIMVDGILYASNGIGLVEAFDPGTGQTLWVQDHSFLGDDTPRGASNRGVAYWADGADKRIFSIRPPYLLVTNASTGQSIGSFGSNGKVDLRYDAETGYSGTSPPVVVKDVVILGSAMADHPYTKEQHPGDVRAYDVRTGELRWTWSPIPKAGEPGGLPRAGNAGELRGAGSVWRSC